MSRFYIYRLCLAAVWIVVLFAFNTGVGSQRDVSARQVEPNWTDAEVAFRSALVVDPTFTTNGSLASQTEAVSKWQELTGRNDLSGELRAFAWWRIGSLLTYNIDRSKGEQPDYERAERAFIEARKLMGDLVCSESLNAASIYGTLPGNPEDRARRLAEAFIWVRSRTEQQIKDSALRVSESGRAIDSRLLLTRTASKPTPVNREELLSRRLGEYNAKLTDWIADAIIYSEGSSAVDKLLESVTPWATPAELTKWIELKSQSKFGKEGVAQAKNPTSRVIVFVCLALPSCGFLLWACWRRRKSSTSAVS